LLYDASSKTFSAAPDVKRDSLGRNAARNERTTSLNSRQTTLQEDDTDMEMDGMDDDDDDDADEEPQDLENDSPEMRELRLQQWRLKNQLKSDTMGVPEEQMPTASTSANANDLLRVNYTVSYHPSLIRWKPPPDLICV
jgi:hypothetical protein